MTTKKNATLDTDLSDSRTQRYLAIQPDIKRYLEYTLLPHHTDLFQKQSTPTTPYQKLDLAELLHDGEILCKLGQLVLELEETKVQNPTLRFKSSRMAFVQMENISWFIQLCHLIGVPQDEIFQTVDLFERKDMYQVCVTIMSFSRIVHELQPMVFKEVVGPKKSKVRPSVPSKPRSLRS